MCADALRLHRHYAPAEVLSAVATGHRIAFCGAVVYDAAAYQQVIKRRLGPDESFTDLPGCVPCGHVRAASAGLVAA